MGGNKLPNLKGCVCLVTGASRGIGRGVSIALGECGATVYLTGRTLKPKGDVKEGDVGGCLEETAAEVTSRGGVGIPVAVDHSDDSQVVNLFARIRREQKGRLDLLVNNAFAAVEYIAAHRDVGFWELEAGETAATAWDTVNRVGLRNHYICATLATRMMLEYRKELTSDSSVGGVGGGSGGDSDKRLGLIINISSIGGLRYLLNVPYGVGKAAVDRMAADMAHELREKKKSVAVLALWPGMVKTEHMLQKYDPQSTILEDLGESPELTGFVIARLLAEPKDQLLSRSGRVLLVADCALQMGIRDTDGNWPISMRSLRFLLEVSGWTRLSRFMPGFVRLPCSVFSWMGSKF